MKQLRLLFPLVLLFTAIPGSSREAPLTSAGEAVKLALRYSGLDLWDRTDEAGSNTMPIARAEYARLTDDRTPFLHTFIDSAEVYRVVFDSVHLGEEDTLLRSVEVLLEANTGRLLRISSDYHQYDTLMPPPPTAAEAEMQLRSAGETYRLPDSTQGLTLYDIDSTALGGFLRASKEFSAVCVVWSDVVSKDVLVWVVTVRGIKPVPALGGDPHDTPTWCSTQLRFVVDAATGKRLVTTNYPLPKVRSN